MRKAILLCSAVLCGLMCPVSVFAAQPIDSVKFAYTSPRDEVVEGYNEPGYVLEGFEKCSVSSLELTRDDADITGKKAVSYELKLDANHGYEFANDFRVEMNGVESVTKVSSNYDTATVKFKAYPYVQVATPSFATKFDDIKGGKGDNFDGRADEVLIDKNGSFDINYVIEYINQDGDVKTKHGTTSKDRIDVGSYNKVYGGTSSNKRSEEILGIAIRGAGDYRNNRHIAPSDWVYIDGGRTNLDVDDYFDTFDDWDDIYDYDYRDGTYYSTSGVVHSVTSPISSQNSTFEWVGSGDTWKYLHNGQSVKGWIWDGTGWYYCDASTGIMKAGWFQDVDGYWYHLHTNHDGFYGRMDIGWYEENGSVYYLQPEVGSPQGCMMVGIRNIDGIQHMFDGNGRLVY